MNKRTKRITVWLIIVAIIILFVPLRPTVYGDGEATSWSALTYTIVRFRQSLSDNFEYRIYWGDIKTEIISQYDQKDMEESDMGNSISAWLSNIFSKGKTDKQADVASWLDGLLRNGVSDDVTAFCFNIYEGADGRWSMELIGTDSFDAEDEDWACDEISDFGSRERPYNWKMKCGWEEALEYMVNKLNGYLENGKYAEVLKDKDGVGVGFVDGNIEIIYSK